MQCLPSPLSLPLAKRLGFPRDLRLWQSHLFLMFLVPLSWKHGGHSVEGWWINLIKMTGPDRDHCPSCTWWNHQDVNSIINTWWTSEFPVIQVKMVLSSGVFCLITDITCVGTAQFTRFQIHSYCQFVCGTGCHEDCWVHTFSRISHHGLERMLLLYTP